VAARAAERDSRLVKTGIRLLESGHFPPKHISELASALATLEHLEGKRRKARKFMTRALEDPTENSVAQGLWIARHMPGFEMPEHLPEVPLAFEASAWEAGGTGAHDVAIAKSWEWLKDEPFARRSAMFGSFVASVAAADYKTAIEFVESAQAANPNDARLEAQRLYCLACANELDDAEEALGRLEKMARAGAADYSEEEWAVLLSADRGLIAFRRGQHDLGRELYQKAIVLATNGKLAEFRTAARVNLAREEVLASGLPLLNRDELEVAVQDMPRVTREVYAAQLQRIAALEVSAHARKS